MARLELLNERDPSRYYLDDVHRAIEGRYPVNYLERALSDFNYDEFPKGGLDNNDFGKLMGQVAKIDKESSRLERPKRREMKKDLGSEVIVKSAEIKRERKEFLSVVGKDLKTVGKISLGIVGGFAVPTIWRKYVRNFSINPIISTSLFVVGSIYSCLRFENDLKSIMIGLGILWGPNMVSGSYEYLRNVRKRAREEN